MKNLKIFKITVGIMCVSALLLSGCGNKKGGVVTNSVKTDETGEANYGQDIMAEETEDYGYEEEYVPNPFARFQTGTEEEEKVWAFTDDCVKVNYETLKRNESNYDGQKVKVNLVVKDKYNDSEGYILYQAYEYSKNDYGVDTDYGKSFVIGDFREDKSVGILENDTITVYGTFKKSDENYALIRATYIDAHNYDEGIQFERQRVPDDAYEAYVWDIEGVDLYKYKFGESESICHLGYNDPVMVKYVNDYSNAEVYQYGKLIGYTSIDYLGRVSSFISSERLMGISSSKELDIESIDKSKIVGTYYCEYGEASGKEIIISFDNGLYHIKGDFIDSGFSFEKLCDECIEDSFILGGVLIGFHIYQTSDDGIFIIQREETTSGVSLGGKYKKISSGNTSINVNEDIEAGDSDDIYKYEDEEVDEFYWSPELVNGLIKNISVSSELQEGQRNYGAQNLIDGDKNTCWCEGVAGVGIGEYIEIWLDREITVQGIIIMNGYTKDEDTYNKNGKVKKVSVIDAYGNTHIEELEEYTYYEQSEFCRNALIVEPITTDYIKIKIEDAVPGTKYDDICISELEVWGSY